jgi:hypothetical protein
VWGFRGPFGAFLGAWGAATMVVSVPFDNWWHNAYGLDVKILSPPHAVLTLGILGVAIAGVLLVLATMNRATGRPRDRLAWVLLVIGGEILVLSMIAILEQTFRSNLHRAEAYRAVAIVAPLIMIALARVSEQRWAATILATFYTAFMATMVWLFPLFHAEPKLGPVYQEITHFIPLEFPLMLIVPAIAIDLARHRLASWPRWKLAPVLGLAFTVAFVAAEWPFASFMQSPGARNAMFGADGVEAVDARRHRRGCQIEVPIRAVHLLPDHGHEMHLFLVRMPAMDRLAHLHPAHADNVFTQDLPSLPAGHYQLFADIVAESGFPVTGIGSVDVPDLHCPTLTGDDTVWAEGDVLANGARMIWDRPRELRAGVAQTLTFRVVETDGADSKLEPYMGMVAHAEVIRTDATVFAHLHPNGSVAMPALELAQRKGMAMDMAMAMPMASTLTFPFGFPRPGDYKIFVQIKRAGVIETASFDARVAEH